MMEKSAQTGVGARSSTTPFNSIYHYVKNFCGVYSIWEGRYTPPISPLLLYLLCGADSLPLFLLYSYIYSVGLIHSPYFSSIPIFTLWGRFTPPISPLPLCVLNSRCFDQKFQPKHFSMPISARMTRTWTIIFCWDCVNLKFDGHESDANI